jgi:hypothetical protein
MKHSCIALLSVLLLLSCTKNAENPGPVPVSDPIPQFAVSAAKFQASIKLIKREVSYLRTSPNIKDVRLFAYDDMRRCTEIRIGTVDSSAANPVFNLRQTLTFNYNGASPLLPSSLSSVRTVFPNLVTNFYFKYNAAGRKVMDSVRVRNMAGDPADRVVHYAYETDRVYTTPVLTGFPMQNIAIDTLSLLSGGNIERLVSRILQSTGDRIVTYTFTYDQHISPYNKLNIANSLYFESSAIGLGYNVPLETHYMGVTTNNMTSYTSGTNTVRFNYLYDGDRYPVRKEMVLPAETTPYQVTYFYY